MFAGDVYPEPAPICGNCATAGVAPTLGGRTGVTAKADKDPKDVSEDPVEEGGVCCNANNALVETDGAMGECGGCWGDG
jgi:hypothetical protein